MTNTYKELFEGKFTTTYSHKNLSFPEKLYYYLSASTYAEKILYQSLYKAVKIVRKKKKDLKILDIGCGGGHEILTHFGKVYGVDISKASIQNAKKIYYSAEVGDVTKKLRFKPGSFDIVFCSEVFGHIDKKDKNKFLQEIFRMLTPQGVLIMSAETLGNNWLTRLLKKKKTYKKYWIDYQGHIGLLTPQQTVAATEKFLDIKDVKKTSTWILSLDGYSIFLDEGFLKNILSISYIRRAINLLIGPFYNMSVLLSRFESANDIVIIAQKL